MANQEQLRKEAAEKYAVNRGADKDKKAFRTITNRDLYDHTFQCFQEGAEWEAEREKWKPIETAPKDGTKITVAIIDGNENHYYPTTASYRCYHQNSKGKEMFRDRNGIKLEKLTHWKPLTPPKTSKQ